MAKLDAEAHADTAMVADALAAFSLNEAHADTTMVADALAAFSLNEAHADTATVADALAAFSLNEVKPASLPKLREASSPSYSGRLRVSPDRLKASNHNSERRLRLDQLKQNRRRRHVDEELRGDWKDRECHQKWENLRRERRERAEAEGVNVRRDDKNQQDTPGKLPPLTPRAASPNSSRIAVSPSRLDDVLHRGHPASPRAGRLPPVTDAKVPSFDEDDPDQPLTTRENEKVPIPPAGPAPTSRRPRPGAGGSEPAEKSRPPPLLHLGETEPPGSAEALHSSKTNGSCEDVVSPAATPGEVAAGLVGVGPEHVKAERVIPGSALPDSIAAAEPEAASVEMPSPVPQEIPSASDPILQEVSSPTEAETGLEAERAPPQEQSGEGLTAQSDIALTAPQERVEIDQHIRDAAQRVVASATERSLLRVAGRERILSGQDTAEAKDEAVSSFEKEEAKAEAVSSFEKEDADAAGSSLAVPSFCKEVEADETLKQADETPKQAVPDESPQGARKDQGAEAALEQTVAVRPEPTEAPAEAYRSEGFDTLAAELDDFLEEDSVIDPNRPLNIEDFLNYRKREMRWHQWPTISDRLMGKRPWSELPPADEAPETAELPLSSEWFREHWSTVRTPSQSLDLIRPDSAASTKHSLKELISHEAFNSKIAQVQRQRDGLPELDPPLLKVDSSLPPPPNFEPPRAPVSPKAKKLSSELPSEPTEYVAEVSIVCGGGWRDADWVPFSGGSDAYCVAEVAGRANKIRTKTIPNQKDAEWNETGSLTITETDSIRFTVYDEDPGKPDDILGAASLKASQVIAGGFDGELLLEESGADKASITVKVVLRTEAADTAMAADALAAFSGLNEAKSG